MQWAWALDATHDANDPQRANKYNIRVEEDARGPDRDLQQLTVNVFQDMGVLLDAQVECALCLEPLLETESSSSC